MADRTNGHPTSQKLRLLCPGTRLTAVNCQGLAASPPNSPKSVSSSSSLHQHTRVPPSLSSLQVSHEFSLLPVSPPQIHPLQSSQSPAPEGHGRTPLPVGAGVKLGQQGRPSAELLLLLQELRRRADLQVRRPVVGDRKLLVSDNGDHGRDHQLGPAVSHTSPACSPGPKPSWRVGAIRGAKVCCEATHGQPARSPPVHLRLLGNGQSQLVGGLVGEEGEVPQEQRWAATGDSVVQLHRTEQQSLPKL
ncbi:hypothetical protein CB1_002145017 [Camelus ferus]|nr:hypothetical protein CB1_002145017 [Camelus ferus]